MSNIKLFGPVWNGLGALLYENNWFDGVKWEKTDNLEMGPIVGYAPRRCGLLYPVPRITYPTSRRFNDGGFVDELFLYDVSLGFDAALMELFRQLPAQSGKILSIEVVREYVNQFICSDASDRLSVFDDGQMIIGMEYFQHDWQVFVILPMELKG